MAGVEPRAASTLDPMRLSKFLVISAGGGVRVVNRTPVLSLDEFAYRLTIVIPDTWASVLGEIKINLPDPDPTVELENAEPEVEDMDDMDEEQ